MAKENYDFALDKIFREEGGYVDHPKDPGGATNMGITFNVLKEWRGKPITKADVKNLSKEEAGVIYRARYWNKIKGDDLPSGIDLVVFDFAVNSGPDRSVRYLQELLGVRVDGVIGPNTLAAAKSVRDIADFVNRFMDKRERFLEGLSTFSTFGKGWLARTSRVRTAALSLVNKAPEKPADGPKPSYPNTPSLNPLWWLLGAAILAAIGVAIFTPLF